METKMKPELNIEKYKMMIKYIAYHYTSIGKTQLNKILFFIDRDYYTKHKETMTSDSYVKNRYGPTPKNITDILDQLRSDGYITFLEKQFGEKTKEVLTLTKNYDDADLDKNLKSTEIEIIDNYCETYEDISSSELTKKTHKTSIFHALEHQQDIPNFILPYYFDVPIAPETIKKYIQHN